MTEQNDLPLTGVSRTAVWVAGLRAEKGRTPDRLFDDPLASAFVRVMGTDLMTTKDSPEQALLGRGWQLADTGLPDLARRYGRDLSDVLDPTAMRAYLVGAATR